MNRRSFISAMLRAGVGAMVLPAAVTYCRKWKKSNEIYRPGLLFEICAPHPSSVSRQLLLMDGADIERFLADDLCSQFILDLDRQALNGYL